MALYADASALVSLLIEESGTDWAQGVLASRGQRRLISDFASGEVASSLSRLVRMRSLDGRVAQDLLRDFDDWAQADADRVVTTPADIGVAAGLVRRFELKLRMPDALHLALARRHGAILVTLDRRLAEAAGGVGVEVAALPA